MDGERWTKFEHKTLFVSCSYDMIPALNIVEGVVELVNRRLPRGEEWEVYHWTRSDHAWDTTGTWQEFIPRPSDPKCGAVICLIGERIGEPLPDYFPVPPDLEVPQWIRFPWVDDSARVPLTGTTFEIVDTLHAPQPAARPFKTFVMGDSRRLMPPGLDTRDRDFGFGKLYEQLCNGRQRPSRNDEQAYDRQLELLDRLFDQLLRSGVDHVSQTGSRAFYTFGRPGVSADECWADLRRLLIDVVPRMLGAPIAEARRREPKALLRYDVDDTDIFFGRETEVVQILNRLEALDAPPSRPILVLTGRSGEGKSSVLRAGIVGPFQLRTRKAYGEFAAFVTDLLPLCAGDALDRLAAAIGEACNASLWNGTHKPSDFEANHRVAKLVEAVGAVLPGGRGPARLFIGFDQAEEAVLEAETNGAVLAQLNAVLDAVEALASAGLAWVVLTLPTQDLDRMHAIRQYAIERLPEPGPATIHEIIRDSVSRFALSLNDAAMNEIVQQAERWMRHAEDPGPVLPLLSALMAETEAAQRDARNERFRAPSTDLSTPAIAPLALTGVLARLAARAVEESGAASLPDFHEKLARLLRHLVATGTDSRGETRRAVDCPFGSSAVRDLALLVRSLLRHRLLYPRGPDHLRLAHLSLIDHWPAAADWYQKDRTHQKTLSRLIEPSKLWAEHTAAGGPGRLIAEPHELDAIEDLWIAYGSDDRLPLEFMRASLLAALTPDGWSGAWPRADGRSRLIALLWIGDPALCNHLMDCLAGLSAVERESVLAVRNPESGTGPLMAAAHGSWPELVERLLAWGADGSTSDVEGWTPLHAAANRGHEAVVRLLLDGHPERAEARMDRQFTPLHLAAQNGHEAVVRLLLDGHAERAEARTDRQATPLHLAAENGHEAVVRLLLEGHPERAEAGTDDQFTPLHLAAQNGHEAVVRLLLDGHPERAEARTDDQVTPLHLAALNGHEAVVRLLLDGHPERAEARMDGQFTPLHLTAGQGHEAVVRLLLDGHPERAEARMDGQATPLHLAALNGHEAVVRLLLDGHPERAEARTDDQVTPLHLAALNGHEAVVRLLLDGHPERAEARMDGQFTPLHLTAGQGHEAVVRLLLDGHPERAEARMDGQATPLHLAAENGHEAVVRLLLDGHPERAKARMDGQATPLHLAAQNGHEAVVRLLLDGHAERDEAGADRQATPLHLAALNGHEAVVRLLLEGHAERAEARMDGQFTPLHLAAHNGHEAVVRLLLDGHAERAEARTDRQATPLHLAAQNGHEAVVRLLLDGHPERAKARMDGQATPLHLAAQNGHEAVVRLLLDGHPERAAAQADYQITPLHLAAGLGREAVVRLLLEGHAERAAALSSELETPLHYAAQGGFDDIMALLEAAWPAIIHARRADGKTAADVRTDFRPDAPETGITPDVD